MCDDRYTVPLEVTIPLAVTFGSTSEVVLYIVSTMVLLGLKSLVGVDVKVNDCMGDKSSTSVLTVAVVQTASAAVEMLLYAVLDIVLVVDCSSLLGTSTAVEMLLYAVLVGAGKVDELTEACTTTTGLLELTVADKVAIWCTTDCVTVVELDSQCPLKYTDGLAM